MTPGYTGGYEFRELNVCRVFPPSTMYIPVALRNLEQVGIVLVLQPVTSPTAAADLFYGLLLVFVPSN